MYFYRHVRINNLFHFHTKKYPSPLLKRKEKRKRKIPFTTLTKILLDAQFAKKNANLKYRVHLYDHVPSEDLTSTPSSSSLLQRKKTASPVQHPITLHLRSEASSPHKIPRIPPHKPPSFPHSPFPSRGSPSPFRVARPFFSVHSGGGIGGVPFGSVQKLRFACAGISDLRPTARLLISLGETRRLEKTRARVLSRARRGHRGYPLAVGHAVGSSS